MPDQEMRQASLEYHRRVPAGKISIAPTKHLTNLHDHASYAAAWHSVQPAAPT